MPVLCLKTFNCFSSESDFQLRWFVADAPILTAVRKKVGHTGFYGCPCCQAPGQTCRLVNGREVITERRAAGQQRTVDDALGRPPEQRDSTRFDGGTRVYGNRTFDCDRWTHEKILEVMETVWFTGIPVYCRIPFYRLQIRWRPEKNLTTRRGKECWESLSCSIYLV